MPVHWVEDANAILWYPPEGKSEAVTQMVNKVTWRSYPIRRFYWDSRTSSKRDAERKANEIRRQEEKEAMDVGESSTDAEQPIIGRKRPSVQPSAEADNSGPPSAPIVHLNNTQRKNSSKPPPSKVLLELELQKKKKKTVTPTSSDDENNDPTWRKPSTKTSEKKRCTEVNRHAFVNDNSDSELDAVNAADLPIGPMITETPNSDATQLQLRAIRTADLQLRSVIEGTPQQREITETVVTGLPQSSGIVPRPGSDLVQSQENIATSRADLHQRSVTNETPTSHLPQQQQITANAVTGLQQQSGITEIAKRRTDKQPSTETTATPRPDVSTSTSDAHLPQQLLQHFSKASRQMERSIAGVNQQLATITQQLTDIKQRTIALEMLLHDRPVSTINVPTNVVGIAAGSNQLTEEQQRLLRRRPLVTNDEHWEDLEEALLDSGQDGPFFAALVQTLKHRTVERSDVHKTANSTLRALVSEPYLAERVTMAGYKKAGNKTSRYYGPVGRPFVKIGQGILRAALFTVVSENCIGQATPEQIQKAIREGLNTIRLHDREVKSKESQSHIQLLHIEEGSQPEFINHDVENKASPNQLLQIEEESQPEFIALRGDEGGITE